MKEIDTAQDNEKDSQVIETQIFLHIWIHTTTKNNPRDLERIKAHQLFIPHKGILLAPRISSRLDQSQHSQLM